MSKRTHSYTSKNIASSKKSGISIATLVIAVITTIAITFFVFKNIDNIKEFLSGENNLVKPDSKSDELHIGSIVDIEGTISNDGDMISYSHRLHTVEFGTLGLVSQSEDLDEYVGNIQIKGTVEKLKGDTFVINVLSVIGEKIEKTEELTGDIMDTGAVNSGEYLSNIGLFLTEDFFKKYEIVENKTDKITFKNIETQEEIYIQPFLCNNSNENTNCSKINESYKQMSINSFINSDGINFHKNSEGKSWFFTNDNQRGYFSEDFTGNKILDFGQSVKFVNKDLIKEILEPNFDKLCIQGNEKIQDVEKVETSLKNEKYIVHITGKGYGKIVECEIEFDPTLLVGGRLIKVEFTEENTQTTGDTQETSEEDSDKKNNFSYDNSKQEDIEGFDTNIEQFPINLENSYVFESSRGHKIIFPSKNISFEPSEGITDKTLGQNGVNCRAQINVVKYKSSDEDLKNNPSVKIYECSIKDSFQTSAKFRHLISSDDRDFVVEILDPSRKEFGDNIVIE